MKTVKSHREKQLQHTCEPADFAAPKETAENGAPLCDEECDRLFSAVESACGGVLPEGGIADLEGALSIVRERPGAEHEAKALALMLEAMRMLYGGKAYQHGKCVAEARCDRLEAAEKAAEKDRERTLPLSFRHSFLAAYGRAEGLPFKQAVSALDQLRALACLSDGTRDYRSAINTLVNGASRLGGLVEKMQASVQPGADETRITFNATARATFCAVLGLPADANVEEMSKKLDEVADAERVAA